MGVNGILSRPFRIRRGARQGFPMSPLLFALYMEPLAQHVAHRVRMNPYITGVKFGSDTHAISLYANDMIVALTDPLVSLQVLV